MQNLSSKRKQFIKLYKTECYEQKQIAEMVGISAQTACKWVKTTYEIMLFDVQKVLATELRRLSKQKPYPATAINNVILQMERLKKAAK